MRINRLIVGYNFMKAPRWIKFFIVFLAVFFCVAGRNFMMSPALSAARVPVSQKAAKPSTSYTVPDWARLVDIGSVNRNIKLDIRYATTNNFLKRKLYKDARCILRAGVAQKLAQVQEDLQKRGLGLKVYDCYRPLSVTKQMWAVLPDGRYVANPVRGSRHNRGAAVDLTLVDSKGKELEMPTGFDDFTEKAWRTYSGNKVSENARKNSKILEDVMVKYGFVSLPTEWWHFDVKGWEGFSLLDVSFGAVPKGK